jgi:hypothetical protein
MRAILVNPYKREVTEVHADFNKLNVLQSYLTNGTHESDKKVFITSGPRVTSEVHTYLDDEGYYRPNQAWFNLKGYDAPLAGYMLILSGTPEGYECGLANYVTMAGIESLISWTTEEKAATEIPPVTITGFKEFGGEPTSYEEFPVDITEKREI